MFKVGERRKPTKVLPGELRVLPVRAEAIGKGGDAHDRYYMLARFEAHDDQKTPIVAAGKAGRGGGKTVEFTGDGGGVLLPFSIDLPAHAFHDKAVVVELWGTSRDAHPDEDEAEAEALLAHGGDSLVGTARLPATWVVNAYGGGYTVSQDEPCSVRVVLEGLEARTYPFEAELQLEYIPHNEHTQGALHRWSSLNFEGTYELVAERSDSSGPLLQQQRVPFILRKVHEYADEQRMEIRMMGGGKRVSFTTTTAFYTDASGPLRVDGLFQSVRTFRGAVVEKRIYFDWSTVGRYQSGEPYPSGVLMVVSRLDAGKKQSIEAFDLSRDRQTLTQLTMVGDAKFRQEWRRVPQPAPQLVRVPKVLTRKGSLLVGVLRAWDLTPEDDQPVAAFAALKMVPFANSDVHYAQPLRDDSKEETTAVIEGEANPEWRQVFSFDVQPEEDAHSVLLLQAWNRESDDEEVLIGTLRVPVPFIFNGYGSELGPAGISSYEATFKLRRGDLLDPSAKSVYGGGRITLRFSYTPDFN